MDGAEDLAGVSAPYDAELERTIQELNRKKAELENALLQVRFRRAWCGMTSLTLSNS